MSELKKEVEALIKKHGLANVYYMIKGQPGFCSNCGCPFEKNEAHVASGLGSCHMRTVHHP